MPLHWSSKDSAEITDYNLDWSLRLASGDTIISSTWSVVGNPASLTTSNPSNSTTQTKIFLTGGTVNQTYTLKNVIVTNFGDTFEELVQVTIKDK